jgi:hypothetical protein
LSGDDKCSLIQRKLGGAVPATSVDHIHITIVVLVLSQLGDNFHVYNNEQ